MGLKTATAAVLATALGACAAPPTGRVFAREPEAPSAKMASRCAVQGDCASVNRRAFYDAVAGRYWWRDARTGRTFWENGTPRP